MFLPNVDLDAFMVFEASKTGIDGAVRMARKLGCENDQLALMRMEWLKRQPDEYRAQVTAQVVALENGGKLGHK